MCRQDVDERLQFFARVNASGRVGRRAQNYSACAAADCHFELRGGHFEILGYAGRYCHGLAAGELDEFHIAHPRRGRDDDFAGVDGGENDVCKCVLGAVANYYLLRSIFCSVFAAELGGYCLAEAHVARYGGIEAVIVLYGGDCCCLYVLGSVEVGLADREVYDIDALSLQLGAFL